MAPALVSNGAVATGTTSATPAFGQPTTAGNLLVCLLAGDYHSGATNSDGTWTGSVINQVGTSGDAFTKIFYKQNCSGSESAPTISATGGTVINVMLAEFSGVATSLVLDKSDSAQDTVATSPATFTMGFAGSPVTDTASGELIVTIGFTENSKAATQTTADTLNNATLASMANNDATSTAFHYRFSWGVTTSNASADVATRTDNGKSVSLLWVAMATFKAGATPVVVRPRRNPYSQLLAQFERLKDGLYAPRPGLWLPRREIVRANDLMLRSLG